MLDDISTYLNFEFFQHGLQAGKTSWSHDPWMFTFKNATSQPPRKTLSTQRKMSENPHGREPLAPKALQNNLLKVSSANTKRSFAESDHKENCWNIGYVVT
jgi:hypothetical protein